MQSGIEFGEMLLLIVTVALCEAGPGVRTRGRDDINVKICSGK